MKSTKIVLLVISIIFSIDSFSQKKIEYGIYMGTTYTSMSGVDYLERGLTEMLTILFSKDFPISKQSRSLLVNGGGFVVFNLNPTVAVNVGLEYNPKGEKFAGELYLYTDPYTYSSDVILMQSTLNMGYLEFPVSFQFSTRKEIDRDKIYFYTKLGASPSLKTVSKQEISVRMIERGFNDAGVTENPIGDTEYNSEQLQGINNFDIGVFASVGASGGNFLQNLFIDLKYEQGVKNILINTEEGDIRNNLVALSIGYRF